MTITAQTMVTQARYRTGKINSTFISDLNDCLPWAEAGYRELYDLLVDAYGAPYFMTSIDFRASSGSRTTDLGSAYLNCSGVEADSGLHILKLIRLEVERDNVRVPLKTFNPSDETLLDDTQAWDAGADIRYFLAQTTFYWQPIPNANACVTMYYVPQPAGLTALTSSIETTMEQWSEFIVLHIAMCIAAKERDTEAAQVFAGQKAVIAERVRSSAPPRDIGQPQRVADVRSRANDDDIDLEGW